MTKIKDVISWIVLVIMLILLAMSARAMYISKTTGQSAYVLGYRVIAITSGSMEPTIKTNALAISKRVDTIEDIAEGDIISFTVTQDDGTVAKATHRIYEIKDNVIYTKGDNNLVVDSYPTNMSEVESKVCLIINSTAWIVNKWQSGFAGKIFICSMALLVLCIYILFKFIGNGGVENEET